MGLYLGKSEKLKVICSNVVYCLNVLAMTSDTNGIRLLSSDEYVLKDINDLYLTAKGDELYGNRI
jgi:hypothetical protein